MTQYKQRCFRQKTKKKETQKQNLTTGLNKRDHSASEEAGPRLGAEAHAVPLQQRLIHSAESACRLMEKRASFS